MEQWPVQIELHGQLTRGMLVVDKRRNTTLNGLIKPCKVTFVTKFNMKLIRDIFTKCLSKLN